MTGADLDDFMYERRLTRQAFATLIGRDKRTVSRWVSGQTPVPAWVEKHAAFRYMRRKPTAKVEQEAT